MKKNLKLWLIILFGIIIIGAIYLVFIQPKASDKDQEPYDMVSSCIEVAPSYIGLTEKEAIKRANAEKRDYAITARDGVSFTVTMDYVIERLNFSINDNIIESTNCG